MTATIRLVACAAAALLASTGCGKKPPLPEFATPAPPLAAFGAPPTADETKTFADRLEKAMRASDDAAVQDCLRVENLFERCISDLNFDANMRAGLLKAKPKARQMGDQLLAGTKDGGSFKLLRVRTLGGKPSAVFRVLLGGGGVTYIEVVVARHPDGVVAAEDLFIHTSGEQLSLTLRRLLLQLTAGLDQSMAGKLGGKDREMFDNLSKIQSVLHAVKAGKHADALAEYRRLPERVQTDKPIQLAAVMAAAEVSEEDYLKEMERFRKAHPNDPSVAMVSIDYHLLRKEFAKCLAAIDVVDKAVGGDPYLQVIRGVAHLQDGKAKEALEVVTAAIKAEPTLAEAYLAAGLITAKQMKYAAAAANYRQGVEKGGAELDFDALRANDELGGFRTSKEFTALEKWYAARKK